MTVRRRTYDREFKQMILELYHSGKSPQEIAEEYDIGKDLVYRWNREQQASAESFPGKGNPALTEEQKEIIRLKKELREAQLERDILKKAVNIFSRNDNKSIGS